MSSKPLPHATVESQPYWDGVAEGRLRLQTCAACHRARHYPQLACPHCYSLECEWIDAVGTGRIHSWTVAHHAFHPAFRDELPYTLVTIDLDEGPRALGRLARADEGPLAIGSRVRITFPPNEEGTRLPEISLIPDA
jgi:uncharacterized protein